MKFLITVIIASFLISCTHKFNDIQTGDIILLPVKCKACKATEIETESPYAHSGLVVFENGKPIVLEAWSKVEKTPLNTFLARSKRFQKPLLVRSKELSNKYVNKEDKISLNSFLLEYFERKLRRPGVRQ